MGWVRTHKDRECGQWHEFCASLLAIGQAKWQGLCKAEEGASVVMMVLMIPVILGFAALAVDASNVYFQNQRMQIAADAAALAGARMLSQHATTSEVDDEIRKLAFANFADDVTWTTLNNNRAVSVVATNTFPAWFARIYGHETFTVNASADAEYQPVTKVDGLFPFTLNCDCVNSDDDVVDARNGTATATAGAGVIPTNTPLPTATDTPVPTSTPIPTATPTGTATWTPTPTSTGTATGTATWTPTPTSTGTATPTSTSTPTPTPTNTATSTSTATSTGTATRTSTVTSTPTNTATNTASPTPTMTPTSTATVNTGSCKVAYSVSNDTGSSFNMALTITNGGSATWTSWVLGFSFGGNQQIGSVTNGSGSQSGQSVSISHVGWNASVAAGGSVSLNFQATYSGANSMPANYKVNGVACSGSGSSGAVSGSATPTPTNTATATSTSLPTSTPTRPPATATPTTMSATIGGQSYYASYAGEELPVVVTLNRTTGTSWNRTSYRFGSSAGWTCLDTSDHSGTGTSSTTLLLTAPTTTGTYQLYIRAHANSDDCNDTPTSGYMTQIPVVVVGQPASVNNPNLATACGLNVILVLDESYSIHSANATGNVRTAANAFLDGLLNTGSNVAIVEFNTSARQVYGYTEVNSTNLTTLKNYVNAGSGAPQGGYDPNAYSSSQYYTNWEDAMIKVKAINSSSMAPLVVFVTDGDPTTYYRADGALFSSPTSTFSTPGVNKAIVQANAIKSQGSHILTVGVGSGLSSSASQTRLAAVSGSDSYSSGTLNLSTTDMMIVASYSGLATALQQIVTALCQSSVTITKMLDPGTGVYAAAANWQFSAAAQFPAPGGTNFSWVLPSVAVGTQTVFGASESNGSITFQLKPNSSSGTSTITIAESAQAGYSFVSVVCTKSSGDGSIITTTGNPFTISNVAANAIVTCVVKNKLVVTPKLTLLKTASPKTYTAVGNVINYTYKLTNDGNVNLQAPYTVSDNKATVSCPSTPSPLTPGSSITCTATYVITQADMNATSVTNIAMASAKDTSNATINSNLDDETVTGPAPTPTATPTKTPTVTPTNTPLPTTTPTQTPTMTPTYTPTNTPTVTPTFTPTQTPTPTKTPTQTPTATNTATATPTQTPTNTPTATPTNTPVPTNTPLPVDTPVPGVTPSIGGGPEGPNACTFSWVDWNGNVSSQGELAQDMQDVTRSGTWQLNSVVPHGPDVVYYSAVEAQLKALEESGNAVKVPLGNENDDGNFVVCGFTNVKLLDFDLDAGTITIEILRTLIHGVDSDPNAPDIGVGHDVRLIH